MSYFKRPVILLSSLFCGLIYIIMLAAPILRDDPQRFSVITLFSITFLIFTWVFFSFPSAAKLSPIIVLSAFALGMFIRIAALPYITADYVNFLNPWMDKFKELGLSAFKVDFSDYNMPYLYFLAILSKFSMYDLYLIKWLSVLFDCSLVISTLLLAERLNLNPKRQSFLISALWLAPTIWLNSALWGQCDSIYTTFVLLAIYFILSEKPVASVAMAAVAFSFKLQTIFFLPLYIIFVFAKKVKIRHSLVFFATYFISILPAWIFGTPLKDILLVYAEQTGTYSSYLNLNSPSMFALLPSYDFLSKVGIVCAAIFILVFYYICWKNKDKLNRSTLMLLCLLFCAAIPWLLPSMHDRYFYMADVLSLIIAFLYPSIWFVAPLTIFASCGGYYAYLFLGILAESELIIPSLCMLCMICIVIAKFFSRLNEKEKV